MRPRARHGLLLLALLPALPARPAAPPPAPRLPPPAKRPVDFVRDVQPLLDTFCVSCHGPKKQRGGLRLDTRASAVGSGSVVPGDGAHSPLVRRAAGLGPEKRMPPSGPRLTAKQISLLRAWVDQGAAWPAAADAGAKGTDHWAYAPLKRPPVPAVRRAAWARTPADAFVLARLEARGLTPSPEADRRTLIRRVTFDLLGLPPTPEEVDAFLADRRPDAYERLVDRLLASPAYGERWARHWMDVIHFAETHGHDQDVPRENAWPYRDYLIRSLNSDKPYGRFVEEQVAGDVLRPGDPDGVVATGLLAAGPWDESSLKDIRDDTADKKVAQTLDRDDMVTTVMSAFVSTTAHCARCHDHKFDPVSQAEYYDLQAVFAGVDRADRAYDPDPAVRRRRRALAQELGALRAAAPATLTTPAAQARVAAWEKTRPGSWLEPAVVARTLALPPERRTAAHKAELARHALAEDVRAKLAALPAPKLVYAAANDFAPVGSFRPARGCRPVHVLKRGDIHQPLAKSRPGALACVPGLPARFTLADPDDEGARRAALARWLSDPRNVLTWRSVVNRAWHYHFGRGIAATPSDLGKMGARPTHPDLLDWLAVEFQEQGGSLKKLHRLVVTSAAYRQSSAYRADCARSDGDNLLLWRMNMARLDAEGVRDGVLAVSGKLDRAMGGPSVKHFVQSKGIHVTPKVDYDAFDVDGPGAHRRSVYRFLFRTLPDPLMDALDCPDASQFAPARGASVTPLQALAMLNDRFMVRQGQHFADRVRREAGPEREARVRRAYLLALGRPAAEGEVKRLAGYAGRHGMANACRLLLNCNEFLFVP